MNKVYAFLATVWFLIITLAINAQPTFYFSPSNQTPGLGEQITVDVLVDGFTDITSYQYSVNWNTNHLSYVSVGNFNTNLGLSIGNFGTTLVSSGRLSTLWSDPLANPQTLSTGSVLFTITFNVVATGPVSTLVQFTGNPTSIEVTQDTGGGIMDITPSVIFLNTTIDIGGGGGGGGLTCNFSGFGILVESDSADTGEQVCLDVSVCNFTNIVSMQYTMQFDPEILQFQNVQDLNLVGLSGGNFGTTMSGNGFVTISWNQEMGLGVTVPNETVIYSICFTAIGAGGSIDSLLINGNLAPIEVTDINSGGNNIGLESIDGEVKITGDLSGAVTVIAEMESGQPGDTVYVDVSVKNFTDMLGLQYSMAWNPAIIDFYETQWTGELPGSPTFNTSPALVDAGKLTFLWTDPMAAGVTVNDNTVIYRVGFIVVGNVGESSPVSFTGDPTAIEATQDNGGNAEVVPLATTSGKVDVTGEGLFGLILSDEVGCPGDTIEVEVSVENFNDIVSMQYDVQWNNAHIQYLGVTGFNLSGLSGGQFNQINPNTIRIAWVEPTITPQTLTDGTVIYKMRFKILGNEGTSSNVIFLDNPPTNPVEISCCTGQVLGAYSLTDATVTVDCSTGGPIVITTALVTDVLCSGALTGAINLTVSGGNGNYTFLWNTGATTPNISNLATGVYSVTITSGTSSITATYTVNIATISTSPTMVSCNGLCDGAIDLIISGNTSSFSYSWSNGLPATQDQANLCAGTYFVTITGLNGCTKIQGPIPVTQPAVLSQSGVVTNETGSNMDGAVNITVSGGTPAYSYIWNNGATTQDISGLSQGIYSVTITDSKGCQITASYSVGGAMDVLADVTDVSCAGGNDGEIHLTVAGGAAPYTYQWNPPFSGNTPDRVNLFAGTYSVTVTDGNGSMTVVSILVGSPLAITITQANVINETGNGCNGSINIEVIGGTQPFTYQWSNGAASQDISNVCKGTYSVTIVDGHGCVFISNTFTVAPAPLAVANSNPQDVSCHGGGDGGVCITVIGGCEPYTFNVVNGGVNPIISVDGSVCFDNLEAGNYNVVIQDSGMPINVIVHAIEIQEPDSIIINIDNIINNTDPSCNNPNGAIDISVSGGTLPFSYQWSNGANVEDPTGLCHTISQNVTVTDGNGCIQVLSNISLNLGLSVVVTEVNDVSCFGECDGSIDITVTGGVTPYTYSWGNQDPFGLCAGTYAVTVIDATGNTVEAQNITINQPSSALTVTENSVSNPNGGQSDGSIDINVTGGWGGYTYLWSNGATSQDNAGLAAGSYTVTVTDANGCQVFFTRNLLATEGLLLELDIQGPSCNGDSDGLIEVFVQGGSGEYTYIWSNGSTSSGISGLAAGSYSVTVTDVNNPNLFTDQDIPLADPDPLTINIISTPSNGGATGSLEAQVSGGTEPYSYLWNDDDAQTTAIADRLPSGEYAVRVEDANGCVVIAQGVVDLGGDCFSSKEVLSFNGNGKNTELIIRCAEKFDNTLRIFNRWGQLVYETTNYHNTWSGVDNSGKDVPEGGYFFVFEYNDAGTTERIRGSVTILR